MKLKNAFLICLLLSIGKVAVCRNISKYSPVSRHSAISDSLPAASFRLIFGLKDTVANAWDGEVVSAENQTIQLEIDRFRNHNYEAKGWSPQGITSIKLGDSKFENDYLKTRTSWVCSTREAPLHGPTTEWHDHGQLNELHSHVNPLKSIIEHPSVLLHIRNNVLDQPVTVKTVQGDFSFIPSELQKKQSAYFINGNLKVEAVAQVQRVASERTGHQDFPAMVFSRSGKLWLAWQEYDEETDQILVSNRVEGQLQPATILADKVDAFHTAIAEDKHNRIWVVWGMQVDGRWDLYGRHSDGDTWSPQQRLTKNNASKNIYHQMITDSEGRMWLVWQRTENRYSQIYANYFDGEKWSVEELVSTGRTEGGNNWWPSVAAGKNGDLAVAWDGYASGSYDIYLRRRENNSWKEVEVVAGTERFEAHPSVTFDKKNRIWLAWDESEAYWGKDVGLLVERHGAQLHQSRSVHIACFDGAKRLVPRQKVNTTFPEKDFWELPHLQTDKYGNPWLFVRHMIMRQPDTPLEGPIDMALWEVQVSRYNGGQWSEPMVLPRSTGRNEMMPASGLAPDGAMWAVWATDNRDVRSFQSNQLQVQLGKIAEISGTKPVLLQAYKPGRQSPFQPFDPGEDEQVRDIRNYKISHGGKVYSIYRGDLHRHTDNSVDGQNDGSLLDAYRYARDAASLDFLGVADHTDAIWEKYAWWRNQKVADLFQIKNSFAALYGYERSVEYPNGHRNIFFSKRGAVDYILPIGSAEARGLEGTQRLYWYLHRYNGISIPHTIGRTSGTDWRDNDQEVEPLIELFQGMRDAYEYPEAPRPFKKFTPWLDSVKYVPRASSVPKSPSFRPLGFAWKALAKGYKLGFIASSDHISTHIAYACLIAEELSPGGLMEAIKSRRSYAATDNIILDIRYKGSDSEHLMGDIFSSSKPVQIKASIMGTGEIEQVDIIKNEAIIHTYKPGQKKFSFAFTDPAINEGESHYYVRVLQQDGEMAWGSPAWVTYRK